MGTRTTPDSIVPVPAECTAVRAAVQEQGGGRQAEGLANPLGKGQGNPYQAISICKSRNHPLLSPLQDPLFESIWVITAFISASGCLVLVY